MASSLQVKYGCKILIVTGELDHKSKHTNWGELLVHGFLEKPFTTEQLFETIERCLHIEPLPLKKWIAEEIDSQQPVQPDTHSLLIETPPPPEVLIQHSLSELVALAPGTVAHLFEIHPRSLRARSIAHCGEGLNWEIFRGKICKSPIGDAAYSSVPIFETISSDQRSHMWTLQMINYTAFCGVPIYASPDIRHALVAFHRQDAAFGEAFRHQAVLCGERIARIVERSRLLKNRQNEVLFAATGMAFECLTHELFNDLRAQDGSASVLKTLLAGSGPLSQETRQEAEMWVGELRKSLSDSIEKAKILRGVRARREIVPVLASLRRAAVGCNAILKDVIDHPESINLLTPKLPLEVEQYYVQGVPANLPIVFFNLYLNAAQQIDLMRPFRKGGKIWHTCEKRIDASGHPWVLVSIHDTGPGIHAEDWDRVFDPGFSNKPNGTGLGLFICRHLLADIGSGNRRATLKLSRSAVWGGTSMTVALPLDKEKREDFENAPI